MRRFRIAVLIGLTVLVFGGGCRRADKKQIVVDAEFERVFRSIKAIEGALQVGVPHAEYVQLVRDLATEVNVIRDRALADKSHGEHVSPVLNELFELVRIHKDAADFWNEYIKSSGADIKRYPKAQTIAARYGLAPREISMYTVQEIWEVGEEKSSAISMALFGAIDLKTQKPKSIEQLREAALKKKGADDCIDVLDWDPDKQNKAGRYIVVGKVRNRCDKRLDPVALRFLAWHGGQKPDGEVVLGIGPVDALEERTFSVEYEPKITGLRLKGIVGNNDSSTPLRY